MKQQDYLKNLYFYAFTLQFLQFESNSALLPVWIKMCFYFERKQATSGGEKRQKGKENT